MTITYEKNANSSTSNCELDQSALEKNNVRKLQIFDQMYEINPFVKNANFGNF